MATSLPQPDYSDAGVMRDDLVVRSITEEISSLGAGIIATVVLDGRSASAGQTSLPLMAGGTSVMLSAADVGVPVTSACTLDDVSVSWLSDTDPGASWVLTFWRRTVGGTMSAAATFSVSTS